MNAKKTLTPCDCSKYFAVVNGKRQGTGCPGTPTARDFAPGHDAKLKGFLIRWGSDGLDVTSTDGTTTSAVGVAKRYGFGHMVEAGLNRPAKPAKKAKVAAPAKPVTAKVGRWDYEGTVADGVFTYKDKQGDTKTTTAFKEV